MRSTFVTGLVALFALASTGATAAPETILTCAVGKKTVAVTQADGKVTYHYGADGKDEMTIVGDPAAKNVFQWAGRYAGVEYQLRFTNGDYSYIVYNMEGNGQTRTPAIAGLVVMQGGKSVAHKSCAKYTEFTTSLDSLGLPEDTEAFSAMSN